jgi:hypothetical protein
MKLGVSLKIIMNRTFRWATDMGVAQMAFFLAYAHVAMFDIYNEEGKIEFQNPRLSSTRRR